MLKVASFIYDFTTCAFAAWILEKLDMGKEDGSHSEEDYFDKRHRFTTSYNKKISPEMAAYRINLYM